MQSRYDTFVSRGQYQYGDKFDASELAPQFIPYFNSGERVRVVTRWPSGATEERTGTIGATGGWRPAFLLIHRRNAIGSSDVLKARDEIVAVQRGRRYVAASRKR